MNYQLSPQDAAKALLHRRSIRRSLIDWCRSRGFEPAAHHRLLIAKLESVACGEIDRLAVFMPPGSAKSTYGSVLFPPWFLAQDASKAVIAASHTAELAEKWGRRVRNIVSEDRNVLGFGVADDNKAAGRWETTAGGEYYAAGVGGSITGRRADLAVIDDPIRGREDADSKLVRDKQWDWYRFDLETRLKPGAAVILIQTRWHEDDLAGRLLAEEGARWHVVRLPMEAEDNDPLGRAAGEPLWPEWFSDDMRAAAKRDMRLWTALYQQRPAPEEGDYFRAEWLRPYDKAPPRETLRIYGASDYAVTSDGGDYTVHVVVGLDPEGRMYLLDLWRKQAASDQWVEAFCDLVAEWKPIGWAEEQGQIRAGIGPYLDRRQRERRAWVAREVFPTRGDKSVRAQSIRGRIANGGLYVPTGKPWVSDLKAEMLSFPAGKHDDQVDALGLVGQLLDKMIAGDAPRPSERPKRDRYSRDDEGGVNWKTI